jgi:hypothetical protein
VRRRKLRKTEVVWVVGASILQDEGPSAQKSAKERVRWDATYAVPRS